MASSRLSRFFMEVAPPQFVTVMRCRTRKMMDTISEEDRDVESHFSSNASVSVSAAASSSAVALTAAAAPRNFSVDCRSVLFQSSATKKS